MRAFVVLLVAMSIAVVFTGAALSERTGVNASDRTFVQKAGQGGTDEIAAARLALTKTTNPAVLAFAHRMIRDHTALAAKLKAAAATNGLMPPATPSAVEQSALHALGLLSGTAFAVAYRTQQIAAHQATITLFVTESKDGHSRSLKQMAATALPLIRMHLKMAKALET
jgi:putative membrane protein